MGCSTPDDDVDDARSGTADPGRHPRRARADGRDVVKTPLVRLCDDGPAEIYLKLENLQPI